MIDYEKELLRLKSYLTRPSIENDIKKNKLKLKKRLRLKNFMNNIKDKEFNISNPLSNLDTYLLSKDNKEEEEPILIKEDLFDEDYKEKLNKKQLDSVNLSDKLKLDNNDKDILKIKEIDIEYETNKLIKNLSSDEIYEYIKKYKQIMDNCIIDYLNEKEININSYFLKNTTPEIKNKINKYYENKEYDINVLQYLREEIKTEIYNKNIKDYLNKNTDLLNKIIDIIIKPDVDNLINKNKLLNENKNNILKKYQTKINNDINIYSKFNTQKLSGESDMDYYNRVSKFRDYVPTSQEIINDKKNNIYKKFRDYIFSLSKNMILVDDIISKNFFKGDLGFLRMTIIIDKLKQFDKELKEKYSNITINKFLFYCEIFVTKYGEMDEYTGTYKNINDYINLTTNKSSFSDQSKINIIDEDIDDDISRQENDLIIDVMELNETEINEKKIKLKENISNVVKEWNKHDTTKKKREEIIEKIINNKDYTITNYKKIFYKEDDNIRKTFTKNDITYLINNIKFNK
jgi:hypothetical protein